MYKFGPYGPQHATAGTFAFKRKLLSETSYSDDAALAEEKSFLKNYTIPFVQLDPMKAILVFSHEHNTFDKRKLLENPHPNFVKESPKTVDMFVEDEDMKDFYMNRIGGLLPAASRLRGFIEAMAPMLNRPVFRKLRLEGMVIVSSRRLYDT